MNLIWTKSDWERELRPKAQNEDEKEDLVAENLEEEAVIEAKEAAAELERN